MESPNPPNEFLSKMRSGVRAAIIRVGSAARTGTRPTLTAVLCAGACVPVLGAALGSGATLAAALGAVGGVGGNMLSNVITGVLDRLRNDHGDEASVELGEALLAERLDELIDTDTELAAALRADMAALLTETGATRTAIEAAIRESHQELFNALTAEFVRLARHPEFGVLLAEIREVALQSLRGVHRIEAQQRRDEDRQRTESRQTQTMLHAVLGRLDTLAKDQEGASPESAAWGDRCPYLGLYPFTQDQAAIFYGRERHTTALVNRVAECLDPGGILAVTGASGAGKSSLLQAGLIPALVDGRFPIAGAEHWPRLVMSPGVAPMESLATGLAKAGGINPIEAHRSLDADPDRAYLLARQALPDCEGPDSARLMLVIDQFEELFTLTEDENERARFIAAITSIAQGGSEPTGLVVLAVRGDFVDRCAEYHQLLPVLQDHTFILAPMTPEEMRQAITGPAATAGLTLDDGLADDILDDLRGSVTRTEFGPAALPLLSQTMRMIWQRSSRGHLTRDAYTAFGGVSKALQTSAEEVHESLTASQRQTAKNLFRRLAKVAPDGRLVRQSVPHGHLAAAGADHEVVLEAFARSRLIVVGETTAEIAHDSLLHYWIRLHTWLEEDREQLALRSRLVEDADQWEVNGRDPAFLYGGSRLDTIEHARWYIWQAHPDRFPPPGPTALDFLDTSRRQATRRRRTRQVVTASLVALLTVSVTAAGVAFRANTELTVQRDRLLAGDLTLASAEVADTDGDLSRLLAAAAWELNPTDESRDALVSAAVAPVSDTVEAHTEYVSRIDISPDGRLLATRGNDDTVAFWDTETKEEVARIEGLLIEDPAAVLMWFSPGSHQLAIHTIDGIAIVETEGFTVQTTINVSFGIERLIYSPSGDYLMAQSGTTIRIWETAHYETTATVEAKQEPYFSVASFNRDGQVVVARDTTAVVIDPATGKGTKVPTAVDDEIVAIGFFPELGGYLIVTDHDGIWRSEDLESEPELVWTRPKLEQGIAYAGRYLLEWTDKALTLVDLKTGRPVRTTAVSETITTATIDTSGSMIALAFDNKIRYIEVDNMTDVQTFDTGYPDPVDMSISADGKRLAVTGAAGTRVWDLDGDEIGTEPAFDRADLPGQFVQLDLDGDQVLITDTDIHQRLYDIAADEPIEVPWSPKDLVVQVPFSPDGRWISVLDGEALQGQAASLTGTDITHISILDAETGKVQVTIEPVNAAEASIYQSPIAYSPDGRYVAAVYGVRGQNIGVWSLEDGRQVGQVVAPTNGSALGVSGLQFSSDSELLVISGGERPAIWDWGDGEQWDVNFPSYVVGTGYFGVGGPPSLTASGRYAFNVSSLYREVWLWNAGTGAYVATLAMTGEPLLFYHYLPKQSTLLGIDQNGTVHYQNLGFLNDPYAAACAATDRDLTEDEWRTYLPDFEPGGLELCG